VCQLLLSSLSQLPGSAITPFDCEGIGTAMFEEIERPDLQVSDIANRQRFFIDNADLYVDHPALLPAISCAVKSSLALEGFRIFVNALQGNHILITNSNILNLLSLSQKFGFRRLLPDTHVTAHPLTGPE
jgi:hypothetical protein